MMGAHDWRGISGGGPMTCKACGIKSTTLNAFRACPGAFANGAKGET